MATLRINVNGANIHPEFPIEREIVPIKTSKRMANGQLREAYVGTKLRFRYGAGGLSEAERAIWINNHPRNSSFPFVDELNGSYTVVLASPITDVIERSVPAVDGAEAGTGATYYRIDVEVEQV